MEVWRGGRGSQKIGKGDFSFEQVDAQGFVRHVINSLTYGSGVQNRDPN